MTHEELSKSYITLSSPSIPELKVSDLKNRKTRSHDNICIEIDKLISEKHICLLFDKIYSNSESPTEWFISSVDIREKPCQNM